MEAMMEAESEMNYPIKAVGEILKSSRTEINYMLEQVN